MTVPWFGVAYGLVAAWVALLLERRVLDGARVSAPPRCEHCANALPRWSTLPIVGSLRAPRCTACGVQGSRASIWPVLASVASTSIVVAAGMPWLMTGTWLLLTPVGVALARIDLAVQRLPDVLTLPAALAAVLLLGVWAILDGGSLLTIVASALGLCAAYLLMHLATRGGMGMGDVKLALALGALLGALGVAAVLVATMLAFILGGLVSAVLLLRRRASRGATIPFGPFMLIGAVATLPLGNPVLSLLGL